MKILNEKEMNLVNGGVHTAVHRPSKAEIIEKATRKWMSKEMPRLHGLADIRIRAAEDALKAAMRANRAEMNIKAAQLTALGLD